jgi:hypothetical protein
LGAPGRRSEHGKQGDSKDGRSHRPRFYGTKINKGLNQWGLNDAVRSFTCEASQRRISSVLTMG